MMLVLAGLAAFGAAVALLLVLRRRRRRRPLPAVDLPDMVWVDLETGGFNEAEHGIVEIAAVRVHPITLEERAVLHLHVWPMGLVEDQAAEKNGYSPEAWARAGAVHLPEALRALAPLLDGASLAGSNPAFDLRFLVAWHRAVGMRMPDLGHRLVDTGALARPLVVAGLVPSAGLDALCTFFGIAGTPHRAMSDARRALAVYKRLMGIYLPAVRALRRT